MLGGIRTSLGVVGKLLLRLLLTEGIPEHGIYMSGDASCTRQGKEHERGDAYEARKRAGTRRARVRAGVPTSISIMSEIT